MKKTFPLLLFALIVLNSESSAQLFSEYGVKAGMTSSNQEWNYSSPTINLDTKNRWGFDVAAFTEIVDFPFLSILAEIGYSQKGMNYESIRTVSENPEGTNGKTQTVNNRIDYLSLFLFIKTQYHVACVNPYLFAGPRLDFQTYKKTSFLFDLVYDELKQTSYGASFGIGIEYSKHIPLIFITEAQYNYDFNDIYETELLEIKNQSIDIRIGLKYSL